MKNWSESLEFNSDHFLYPENVSQVQEICKNERYRYLKAVGTRHSFTTVADTMKMPKDRSGKLTAQICLEKMQKIYFGTWHNQPTVSF